VDDDSRVNLAIGNRGHDPVKAHNHSLRSPGQIQTKKKGRGGIFPGNGDPGPPMGHKILIAAHQQGPATPSQGGTGAQEHVVVEKMAQGVKGKFGHIQIFLHGPPVQLLDIGQQRLGQDKRRVDQAMGQGIEDIGVIWTGRVTYGNGVGSQDVCSLT